MKIKLVEVVVLVGEAVSADDHIVFYDKVHGITGLVSASPEEFVIFQIIGEHEAGIRLGVAVCHAGTVENTVLQTGIVSVDVPFVGGIG